MSRSTLRRMAARKGRGLWEVRDSSPFRWEYGPFYLTSLDGVILEKGLDARDVREVLSNLPDIRSVA